MVPQLFVFPPTSGKATAAGGGGGAAGGWRGCGCVRWLSETLDVVGIGLYNERRTEGKHLAVGTCTA